LSPVVGFVALSLGLVGFVFGTGQVDKKAGQDRQPAPAAVALAGEARSYSEMPQHEGPNAGWSSSLDDAASGPHALDPVDRDPRARVEDLADRARLRAYSGAPPVIPHAVDSLSGSDCVACHAAGLALGDRLAPRVPHSLELGNCTQCHAPPAPSFLRDGVTVETRFVGLEEQRGSRAGPGAPPLIPHDTTMRSDCLSCHGLRARPGLRTTHPWRVSCTQCHGPPSFAE
jgi:nitrate reductase (cytochrome), electron transfer subunit